MKPITSKKVLFIKLGEGGEWEESCIKNGELKIGFRDADFQTCQKGDWKKIAQHYQTHNTRPRDKKTASRFMGELRYFFEEPVDTLWITYYNKKVWWAFARSGVTLLDDNRKIRKVIDKWHDCDVNGNHLTFDNLSGQLLRTQGYQGTICKVSAAKYLINKINGVEPEDVINAKQDYQSLKTSIEKLIKKLSWQDFELFVDLIFRNAGWQRLSVVGKTEKTLDLDLQSPVTLERALVQVKSQSTLVEFQKYLYTYKHLGHFHKFFFVVHTSKDKGILVFKNTPEIIVWRVNELAELTIDSGLAKWLIKKSF
jgi:hypothetical protein